MGEPEIISVNEVYKKIGQEIGNNCNQKIQDGEEGVIVFLMANNFCH
jgi:hypothetical protein